MNLRIHGTCALLSSSGPTLIRQYNHGDTWHRLTLRSGKQISASPLSANALR
jgi:hypothetical protein